MRDEEAVRRFRRLIGRRMSKAGNDWNRSVRKSGDEQQESISQKLERGFDFWKNVITGAEHVIRSESLRMTIKAFEPMVARIPGNQLLGGEKLLKQMVDMEERSKNGIAEKGRIMREIIGNQCAGTVTKILNAE